MFLIGLEQPEFATQCFQILSQGGVTAQLGIDRRFFVRLKRIEQVTDEIVSHGTITR